MEYTLALMIEAANTLAGQRPKLEVIKTKRGIILTNSRKGLHEMSRWYIHAEVDKTMEDLAIIVANHTEMNAYSQIIDKPYHRPAVVLDDLTNAMRQRAEENLR